jgi:UPF0755 protein
LRTAFRIFLVILFLTAAFFLYRALSIYRDAVTPRAWEGDPVREVRVPAGANASDIATLLQSRGILENRAIFLRILRTWKRTRALKAGVYRFASPISPLEAADQIIRGEVAPLIVMIPEGLDAAEVCRRLAAQFDFLNLDRLLEATADPSLIADLDPGAKNLEGYLFPDTYSIRPDMKEKEVIRLLVQRFRKVFVPGYEARCRELNMTVRQAITLASIVEKETGGGEERGLVASVFHNRLVKKMPLGADPTIIYALKQQGRFDGNLRKEDLKLDSPYNSYTHAGLPPGPIANPGAGSIRAALYPGKTDYLYFVSMNNGRHYFSRTAAEHARAVDLYQKTYWREHWREERRAN